jgi:plasmid replication initiation protein
MLGVPPSYTWNIFERKVLEVAKTELLEKSNIHMNLIRKKKLAEKSRI